MLDLAVSVLCSSLIFVVFKLFDRFQVQTLYAIIINYLTACTTGLLLYQGPIAPGHIVGTSWFLGGLALGAFFIFVFRIMAQSSQQNGVGVTSVATKMSLVIPVLFALFYFKESLSWIQVIGIFLALAAVYFASLKKRQGTLKPNNLWLPFLVFLGSGIIDTSLKFFQETLVRDEEFALFSSTLFATAGATGIAFVGIRAIWHSPKIRTVDLIGGVALGVPNYFSIFFLLRALQNDTMNSSVIFTLNNVAIVMFSTLLGIVLFKEQLTSKNWGGILLAIISIFLVALF